MKKLPDIKSFSGPLFDIQYGMVKAQIMMTAIDMKVFNHTVTPADSGTVATAIGTHRQNTDLFLNALSAIGLLSKNNGMFENTVLSTEFLVEGKESWLGDFMMINENWLFPSRREMRNALISGPAIPERNSDSEITASDEDFLSSYTMSLKNLARSGIAQSSAEAISKLPGFHKFRRMLDLGGAHGLDCIAIVQKSPLLKGTVFDKPPVVSASREIISEYGMENRVDTIGGDYINDPIGEGYDLIYAKGTLNFTGPALDRVMQKIYEALNPGGVFVSLHEGLYNEKTQPEGIIVSWLPTAMSAMDVSLEKSRIPAAMAETGFKNMETDVFHFPLGGELDMVAGWKL